MLNSVGTIEVIILRCQLEGQPSTVKQTGNKKNEQNEKEQKGNSQKSDQKKKLNVKIKGSALSFMLDGASDSKRKYDSMLGLDGTHDQFYNPHLNQFLAQQMPPQLQQQNQPQQQGPAPQPAPPSSTNGMVPQVGYQPGPQYPYYNQQGPQQFPPYPAGFNQAYGHPAMYNAPQPYPPAQQFQQYPTQSFNAPQNFPPIQTMYGQNPQPLQRGFVGTQSYKPTNAPAASSPPKEKANDNANTNTRGNEKEKKEDGATEQTAKKQPKNQTAPAEFRDAYGQTFHGWVTLPASVTSSANGKIKDDDPVTADATWGETKSTTSNKPEDKPEEAWNSTPDWNVTTTEEKKEDKKKEQTNSDPDAWATPTPADDKPSGDDDKKDSSNGWDTGGDGTQDSNNQGWDTTTADATKDNNNQSWETSTSSGWDTTTAPAAAAASTEPTKTKRTTEPAKRRKKKDKSVEDPKPPSPPSMPTTPSAPLDPTNPHLKPYFTTWTQSTSGNTAVTFILPAEPPPNIPESHATTANITHQLQTGAGIPYTHRTSRPRYLDTMAKPYAVFVFKYRSREKLAEILQVKVEEIKLDRVSLRGKIEELSKEQLLEMFMKAKAKAGYATDSSLDSSGESGEEEVVVEAKKEEVVVEKKKKKDTSKEQEKEKEQEQEKASAPAAPGVKGNWNEAPAATTSTKQW